MQSKETKPEQIEVLEQMKLPDYIIALIIGSTADSVKTQRSQRKAKVKKAQESETAKNQDLDEQ